MPVLNTLQRKAKAVAREKRRSTRISMRVKAKLIPVPGRTICEEAMSQDFSGEGIRFKLKRSLKKDDRLKIFLYFAGESEPITVYGKVVWLQKKKKEIPGCVVGIRHTKIAAKDRERFILLCGDLMMQRIISGLSKGSGITCDFHTKMRSMLKNSDVTSEKPSATCRERHRSSLPPPPAHPLAEIGE